jgi:hypothetical protein
MEGQQVQAPNSYLNTLFILNQRRSGGLAEAVPITIKFGTTLDQIDALRLHLLDFVSAEKREYQSNIVTELRDIQEAHSIVLNVVFFYKSNWQNELLRLQRRNKFICALMVALRECGIEGPRMRYPGFKEEAPVYLRYVQPPDGSAALDSAKNDTSSDPPFVEPAGSTDGRLRRASLLSPMLRARGESISQMGRRVDFSLGLKDLASGDLTGDVYADRARPVIPVTSPVRSENSSQVGDRRRRSSEAGRSSSVARSPLSLRSRLATDASLSRVGSVHRNRFFGRGPRGDEAVEDMELGMANIPEDAKLDPRTGMISPIAYRVSSDDPRPRT